MIVPGWRPGLGRGVSYVDGAVSLPGQSASTRRTFLRRVGGSMLAASSAGQLELSEAGAATGVSRPRWRELEAKLGRKLVRPGDPATCGSAAWEWADAPAVFEAFQGVE